MPSPPYTWSLALDQWVDGEGSALTTKKKQFLPGMWIEWSEEPAIHVTRSHVDRDLGTVQVLLLELEQVTRYVRVFVGLPDAEVGGGRVKLSLALRSMHLPASSRLDVVHRDPSTGWWILTKSEPKQTLSVPLGKAWARMEGSMTLSEATTARALMWEFSSDVTLCISEFSIEVSPSEAGEPLEAPVLSIRPLESTR